jgi:hypothetical protein
MKLRAESPDRGIVIVHHVNEKGIWGSNGRTVLHAEGPGKPWKTIATFPLAPPRDYASIGRLARRLLRAEKCNVYPTREGKLLGIRKGWVYSLAEPGGAPPRALFQINGACVMPRAIAEDPDGNLYFGEYFGNPDRGPVRIWRVDPLLESFGIAYTFPAGATRHIHAVHTEPFMPGRIWVTMGDFQDECYLAYTDDDFSTVHFLGDGSQLWRLVGVIFQEDRLCWLTDTHFEQNHIVAMDRSSTRATIHGDVDASAWYMAETTDGLYLATTTVELGAGIQTNEARVLASEDGLEWEPIIAYRKDPFPMTGFGFGSISLPSGAFSSESFWISGEGVWGLDGRAQVCSLKKTT